MAAIDDLIAQVEDQALRERLRSEAGRITKEKKFGLVFEDHLPELTPIYSAKVRKDSKVAIRDGALGDLWRVLAVSGEEASCRNIATGEQQTFSTSELVVVCQFGEPIFPALVPVDRVQNGPDDAPWHTLIEADNYHALQLLEYLYPGKVDCIYIDPPYNTGARDWKYNNDYVDKNDRWRHSKWMAMIARRLNLAKRLLRQDGCVIVTIDDYEASSLGMWLDDTFRDWSRTPVVIRYNRQGSPRSGLFRTHEYAFYLTKQDLERNPRGKYITTRNFRRNGSNSTRIKRRKMFFPIQLNKKTLEFQSVGKIPEAEFHPETQTVEKQNVIEIWPVDDDGNERCWQWGREAVESKYNELEFRRVGEQIHGYYQTGNLPILDYETVLVDPLYDASTHGRSLVREIVGINFPFPKSLYAVKTCIEKAVWNRPNAIILDFFAGSGTTAHAVNLLNATDGGFRRTISVTNNEVAEEDAVQLRTDGSVEGEPEWESHGICQSVTWPRSKFTIIGHRDDGTELDGEYFTGMTYSVEKPRGFKHISFSTFEDLPTAAKKKQLVALIDGIPQSEVKKDSAFIVSEKYPASILFDEAAADDWLEALEDAEHVTDFYIVAEKKATFDALKDRINELLGPISVSEAEKATDE